MNSTAHRLIALAGRDINVTTTTRDSPSTGSGQAFTRTAIERVAGLYVSGPAGVLVAAAGRDITLTAAQITNSGGQTLLAICIFLKESMLKKIFIALCSIFTTSNSHSAPNDNNKVIEVTFIEDTKAKIGVPAELPDQLIKQLSTEFSKNKNIELGKISLAEFTPQNSAPFFSYVIGLRVIGDSKLAVDSAIVATKASHGLRIPVIIVDINQYSYLFTSEAIQFYALNQ